MKGGQADKTRLLHIIWTIVTKDIIAFEKQINQLLKDLID